MEKGKERVKINKLPVEKRIKSFEEVVFPYTEGEALEEAKRCLQCKKEKYCIANCPANCDAAGYIKKIVEGDFLGALKCVFQSIPLPAVCGRVCPHPCQKYCLRGKKGDSIAIRHLKRFVADRIPYSELGIEPSQKSGKKVAIVGSGPAGLACAYELVLKGHKVDIYESLPFPGGMLAFGIPEYRLPKKILKKEVGFIESLGVDIKTGTPVENVKDLRSEYDAILIAVGAHIPQKLGIEGEDLNGVIHATTFLREVNTGNKVNLGGKVAVIGGGNVAIDAVRTAVRLGVESAFIVYRRSLKEMPAGEEEIEDAQEEGVKIHFLAAPLKIVGKNSVESVECIKMELGPPDESGRRTPIPVKGSNFTIELTNVIPAISQVPDLSCISNANVEVAKNAIVVNKNFATTQRGIFAAGDCVLGPKTVVEAIATGRKSAESINEYLKKV